MSKRVVMGPKPTPKPPTITTADDWVNASAEAVQPTVQAKPEEAVAMKRLTLDVSESLHRRIKTSCAIKGVNMADELRGILEEHFPTPDL